MSRSLPILLVALAGVLVFPAAGAATGWEDPPPEEIPPPPPATSTDPTDTVAPPAGPSELTITVPPLPVKKAPAPKAAPKKTTSARTEPVRRHTPSRSARVAESADEPSEPFVPVAESTPAKKPVAKAKPHRKKLQRPQPRAVAKAVSPIRTIRDREPAGAVLAAQFTLGDASAADTAGKALLVLALALASLLGVVLGIVGAAPLLADRWPKVFVPVIDETERIVLAGVCLAGAALTLVITWALTGPGA